jgi:hypothetical protein
MVRAPPRAYPALAVDAAAVAKALNSHTPSRYDSNFLVPHSEQKLGSPGFLLSGKVVVRDFIVCTSVQPRQTPFPDHTRGTIALQRMICE